MYSEQVPQAQLLDPQLTSDFRVHHLPEGAGVLSMSFYKEKPWTGIPSDIVDACNWKYKLIQILLSPKRTFTSQEKE